MKLTFYSRRRRRETAAHATKRAVVLRRVSCMQIEAPAPKRTFQDQLGATPSARPAGPVPPKRADRCFLTCRKGAALSAKQCRLFRPTARANQRVLFELPEAAVLDTSLQRLDDNRERRSV